MVKCHKQLKHYFAVPLPSHQRCRYGRGWATRLSRRHRRIAVESPKWTRGLRCIQQANITSWFLLFAFSDGTSPDFGPSSRGFIESLTGVHLEEPQDQELVMWKSIYSCIHRQNFQFQVLWAYNLTRHIKAWNPADEVFINVFDFPTGSAAPTPTLPTSRAA